MSLLDTQEEIEQRVENHFPISGYWLIHDKGFDFVGTFSIVETYQKRIGEITKITIRKYLAEGKFIWMYEFTAVGRVGLLKRSGQLTTRQDLIDVYKTICDHIGRNV